MWKGAKTVKLELHGEFKNKKHMRFDGEVGEATHSWLFNMNKYFQFYEHNHSLKARLEIYQLHGKTIL